MDYIKNVFACGSVTLDVTPEVCIMVEPMFTVDSHRNISLGPQNGVIFAAFRATVSSQGNNQTI